MCWSGSTQICSVCLEGSFLTVSFQDGSHCQAQVATIVGSLKEWDRKALQKLDDFVYQTSCKLKSCIEELALLPAYLPAKSHWPLIEYWIVKRSWEKANLCCCQPQSFSHLLQHEENDVSIHGPSHRAVARTSVYKDLISIPPGKFSIHSIQGRHSRMSTDFTPKHKWGSIDSQDNCQ